MPLGRGTTRSRLPPASTPGSFRRPLALRGKVDVVISRVVLTALIGAALSVAGTVPAAAKSSPQPHSIGELVAMISAKGLGCHDFQPAPPPLDTSGGTCTVGHEFGVGLSVFASHAALTKQAPNANAALCSELRKSHSSVKLVFVIGPNWVAIFESKVNARPLAAALGAKVKPLKCNT